MTTETLELLGKDHVSVAIICGKDVTRSATRSNMRKFDKPKYRNKGKKYKIK